MVLPPDLVDEAPPVDTGTPSGLRRRKNNQRSSAVKSPLNQSQSSRKSKSMPPSPDGNGRSERSEGVDPKGNNKSYVDALMSGAMRPSQGSKSHNWAISTIDRHFRYFAIWNICMYATLVVIVYIVVPNENIVRLEGVEQSSAIMAMSLIAMSFLSRTTPLLGGIGKSNKEFNISGIFIGGLTVQFVAFSTDFLMSFFPTPLLIDPVLGTRVHILRWCEWAPCAAYMTFMMEGSDLYWSGEHPPPDYLRRKYLHAVTQGAAVFLGFLFPFCPGYWSWMVCFIGACSLYLTNFPRIRERRLAIPDTLRDGATVEEAERFNSSKAALRLRYATTIVWSIIVMLFFVSSVIGPKYAPEGSFLHNPAANMVCECFLDVASKVVFLAVIGEVHHAIFDPSARTERRLEELRELMAAVWDSSSDIIAISVRTGQDSVSTMLSPAFFGLGTRDGPLKNLTSEQVKDLHQRSSVLYQLSGNIFQTKSGNDESNADNSGPTIKPENIFDIEETGFSKIEPKRGGLAFKGGEVTSESGALRAVSDIVVKAWACKERERVFPHNLRWANEDGLDRDHLVCSEAKVSRLDDNALILVVRDISERVKVFEAEKQILFETTSRQKDAEANRFTRHEVKNGLLSAIGLYESLCEAQGSQLMKSRNKTTTGGVGLDNATDISEDVVRCMNELGKSLQETLDTILIEAMTRDLIHDLYRPHREKIDVSEVLSGFDDEHSHSFDGVGNLTRFPLIMRPSPLPRFYFDPNILRYLHRQALSNACKYGKTGGTVLTEILYDEKQEKMEINVINLPGNFHNELIAMGSEAEESVFEKSCQVHTAFESDAESRVSKKSEAAALPGDGGWIIRKCAKIMKGECSIKFEESRTVFSLNIPAHPLRQREGHKSQRNTSMDVKTFVLPNRIWGIAIDDSKIQMKLLGKYMEFAGIQKDRIKVFGKNAEEIMGFVDYVVNFMDENMGDPVLLIADENLDLTDDASKHITISGSQLVENIRLQLLPEQEKQLVALIRSANDSSSDVAIYNSRAHGFLPKAPIKKGNVLEALAPLWIARYPQQTARDDDSQSRGSLSLANSASSESLQSLSSLNDFIVTTPFEIMQIVNQIDVLFSKGLITDNWNVIWEKLHILKGDLLTLQVSSKVISAVGMINSFRELSSDEDIMDRWGLLREHISHWLNSM